MAKVKWPANDVMSKCCDVYSLFDQQESFVKEHQEDWMLSYEFLNIDRNVVIVEEKEPLIEHLKDRRFYIGFDGINLNDNDISDVSSVVKTLLSNYDHKNHLGFHKQASDRLELVLTKLHELETCEDSDSFFSYDVIFCGYAIGGSMAAVAFINLLTRQRLRSQLTQVPIESIMTLKRFTDENITELQEYCQEYKKVTNEYGHLFRCINHGATMFGNEMNKEYCMKKSITKGIFNVVHESDPLPKLFYHLPLEFQDIQANNAIGNFRILKNNNNKIYTYDISSKASNESEDFFITNETLPFDNVYHQLDLYKTPVNQGNTEMDMIQRINKDFESLTKPYIATDIIGKGQFGVVCKATNSAKNTTVAIKKINTKIDEFEIKFEAVDNEENLIEENSEIENLNNVQNEHVVKLTDYFNLKKQKIYLVFEYCSYGSLEAYIKSTKKGFNENELRTLSYQLLDGLSAIHDEKIIHRDIKPANVLVTSLQNGNVCYKISDLGSSLVYQGRRNLLTAVGTKLYMSPEIYLAYQKDELKVKISPKTDIFSLGAVILFCINHQNPWSEHEFDKLIEEGFEEMVTTCSNGSETLKDMLISMLQVESNKRVSAETLLLHPFIKDDRVKLHIEGKVGEFKELQPAKVKTFARNENNWVNNEVEKDLAKDFVQMVVHIDKGIASSNSGYYTDGIANFNEVLKIATYIKENDGVELFMESVAKFKETDSLPWLLHGSEALESYISFSYRSLGICHQRLGAFKEAIEEGKKSVEISRKLEKNRRNILNISLALNDLGRSYIGTADFKEAQECLEESIVSIAVAWNIHNTDEFKAISGLVKLDHVEIPSCNSDDDRLPSGHWSVEMTMIINNLAESYLSVGKRDEFLSHTKASYNIMNNHSERFEGENVKRAAIHANIGAAYLNSDDQQEESLFHLQKALEISKVICNGDLIEFPENPQIISNLGLYYLTVEKNYLRAIEYYQKGLELNEVLYKKNRHSMGILGSHDGLATCYLEMKNTELAIFHFEQLVNIGSGELYRGEYKSCVQLAYRRLGELYEPIEPLISKYYFDKYADTILDGFYELC